jgi:arginase
LGPRHLVDQGLLEQLRARGIPNALERVLHPAERYARDRYAAITDLCARLACEVASVMTRGGFPVVLGGDHSCAIGTWCGAARVARACGPLGLVWIDAHMDSHTPATSYSGMPHGMPLAALLGHGGNRRQGCATHLLVDSPVSAAYTCVVGVRSYEPEEQQLLRELGVRVFDMRRIARCGLQRVMRDALSIARRADGGYGVSIDLDAVDPHDAPGVGSPVANGLSGDQLVRALSACADDARLRAVEIAEYNPCRDIDGRTAVLIQEILAATLADRHVSR